MLCGGSDAAYIVHCLLLALLGSQGSIYAFAAVAPLQESSKTCDRRACGVTTAEGNPLGLIWGGDKPRDSGHPTCPFHSGHRLGQAFRITSWAVLQGWW